MQNGEAKTNINCLFFASFLAGGFPCIISCVLHNNRAWHATQFCLTSVESGGSKSRGSRVGKEGSQDLNRIHLSSTHSTLSLDKGGQAFLLLGG